MLVVSALASASAIRAAYRAGADVYLDKPFDIPEFLASVEALLDARIGSHVPSEGGQHYRVSSPVRD